MAAAPKTAPDAAAPDAPPAPGKKKRLILAVLAVAALAIGGGAAWFLLGKKGPSPEADKAAAEAPKAKRASAYIPFEPLVVNLRDEAVERMMQIAFSFEAADPKAADLVKQHAPAIRNRLILLLTSKTSLELAGREGKEKLAAEIVQEARAAMGATKEAPIIEAVHFSSLIVQ